MVGVFRGLNEEILPHKEQCTRGDRCHAVGLCDAILVVTRSPCTPRCGRGCLLQDQKKKKKTRKKPQKNPPRTRRPCSRRSPQPFPGPPLRPSSREGHLPNRTGEDKEASNRVFAPPHEDGLVVDTASGGIYGYVWEGAHSGRRAQIMFRMKLLVQVLNKSRSSSSRFKVPTSTRWV